MNDNVDTLSILYAVLETLQFFPAVEDFVAYDEVFTFEQDGESHQERDIVVGIVDDDINEAAEEFLLFFDIVDSDFVVDEIITSVERNPTRCRIMNDDGEFQNAAH